MVDRYIHVIVATQRKLMEMDAEIWYYEPEKIPEYTPPKPEKFTKIIAHSIKQLLV